ncbi:MAG: CehA/McbA family metallohydrolase [Lentisphaeria bacterium]|nr:CehA/McbA family metallohydrolase [Lentisphaeria bacterium]
MTNPFEIPGTWYKANLHVHTTTSDGGLSPRQTVEEYRRAGYAVLALTDHLATNDVRGLSDEGFLVIGGVEYHPHLLTRPVQLHLVGLNVPHGLAFDDGEDANRCLAQVRQAGGETVLAHPFWSGLEYADFCHLEGLAAVEVYNFASDENGRGDSENEWAYVLDRGIRIPAVAVDDAHFHCRMPGHGGEPDAFGGWTWLKLPSLTVENVLEAVRTGAFYASGGPMIEDFRIERDEIVVHCSPARRIYVKTNAPGGGQRRIAEPGEALRTFCVPLSETWEYVRAVVVDAAGKHAWTNPIFMGGAK